MRTTITNSNLLVDSPDINQLLNRYNFPFCTKLGNCLKHLIDELKRECNSIDDEANDALIAYHPRKRYSASQNCREMEVIIKNLDP